MDATGHWLKNNWEYVAGGAMVVAGGALMITGVGGPVGAMLISAGADTIIQKATTGSVNWGEVGVSFAAGAVGGGFAAAKLGATGLRGAMVAGAVSGGVGGGAMGGYQYASSPGPHTAGGFLGATAGGAGTGAVFGSLGGAASHGASAAGSKLLSGVRTVPEPPNEAFYRTMHPDHYAELVQTGRVPATHETFVSPSREYASGYDGVTVELQVRPGTQSQLESMGVRNGAVNVRAAYPDMPKVSKGWAESNAHFKGEGDSINISLGHGPALETFNDNLVHFKPLL